ncbi:MAG: alpha/beta hydrolase [Polaromonas sp. 39-63-203]|uniref:alpha/beta hydrolase n=1 Tax=Polaromonas sp. TaxID=1869339 RepID=UPI000BDDBD4E|nr:alpha/beta hydrolase [Polaromonas sp.]OYY51053.1 MAG: alpha/beta hydrolase [Polaromonas sp. 35-63-240]OYY98830.1 MAG: alpha/beta hydrolase [Polaromonas sp. 28-63-22]OYZ81624.1 MAG: alpha/beta hydrolase [Polaromonas sp. 24-62-144]OZA95568.1 MAG: alpha/beta hydrolase [Polaromonas sp. 39-63-203]HQS32131.1 alpha/beta hydrolase [Polaromonas sp.]
MADSSSRKSFSPPPGARPPAGSSAVHDGPPPSALLLALELRAFWEFGAVLPAWPVLARAPKGDGHAVMVFPGLSANDVSTLPLRSYVQSRGYSALGWEQGFNFGPRAGVLDQIRQKLVRTFESTGRKVSLIGWSLGGVYARELAKDLPHMVRGVITLGTPFGGSHRSTNAWRIYELASGRSIAREAENYDLPAAPPVPTTSIFSRSDGIVAWKGSIQAPSAHNPHTENIEVLASHVGLGLNPSAWWAVADRLAQAEGVWQPFKREQKGRLHGLLYPDPSRA